MEFEQPKCVNCLKQYTMKEEGRRQVLPLLLACGHTYCSSCLSMMGRKQKHTRHIMCPECKAATHFNCDYDVLDQLPPNLYLLGIMVAKQLGLKRIPVYHPAAMRGGGGGYNGGEISYTAPRRPAATDPCVECTVAIAMLKCEQCLTGQNLYCDSCFKSVHASSNTLRRHTSVPASEALRPPEMCHTHPTELLRYFCQDDEVPICSGCAITGTHKGHAVVSLADASECYREQLDPLLLSASETLKHLKQTEKSVSEQLSVLHAKSLAVSRELHVSFTSLHGFMQKRELSLLEELADATSSYTEPLLKLRSSLRVQTQSVTSTITKAVNAFEDSLELARSAKQLITELQRDTNLQQELETGNKEPIRFILDVSVRKQLQKVGTISYTHEPNGEVSNDRGHSPLTLLKPSPSPRSLTPCSPARSQNRSSSRSPTVNSGTCSPIPRVEGRRGERSRSASASPIPPVTVEETKEVIVTHMVSPGEFYVQFMDKHRELQRLMNKINTYCRTPHPLKHIRADLPCAAQFSEDKVWYRAVIEDFHESYATVFYTDFGNLENVTPDRLSSLPLSMTSPPPFCHHAMLDHLSPPGRHEHVAPLEWSQRAKCQFKALIEANITNPIRVKVYKEDDLGLHVDVLLPSVGPHLFSVSQKLIAMGLAVRTHGRKREAPNIPPPALPAVGAEVQVQVSTAYSPHNFHVQMISTEDDRVSLADQLDQEVAMVRTPGTVAPQKGMFCSAQFQEDGKWYRAKVNGVTGERVEVLFVDFGNVDVVSVTALKALPPQLMMLPMQAIHCRLDDVESATNPSNKWSEQVCDYFHEVVDGQLLSMSVCGEGTPLPVTLTDIESSRSISSLLLMEGLARSKSHSRQSSQNSASSGGSKKEKKKRKAKQQTPPQHVCTPVITKQPATPPIPRLSSPPAEPEGSKEKPREIPPCQTPQQKDISPPHHVRGIPPPHHVRGIPPPQLPPLGESACTIVQVTSPSEFHVHISSEAVGSLRSILAGITHTTHIKVTTGDVCLSQFEGEAGWHRVRVEEELSGGKLRVKYLDYGNTELVSSSAVAALSEALLGVPALAVRCALEGVEPVGGARAWPMEVSQYFSQLVMERASFITVNVLPADSQAPLPVQLVIVNKEGGRDDIGSLLITNNLGSPFPSTRKEDATQVPSSSSPSSSSYLPAKPPKGDKFVIMVTYVTSEGVIYGHIEQEGLQVPLLAEKLQLLCKGRLRVKGVTSLTPGQPCLARFRGDGEGRWYRVKVEKCNEDNTAMVFYVDFGNKDILRCSQLIDVAPLMEVPIQASAMRLANTDGVEWTSDRVSALADLITGQTLDGVIIKQSGLGGHPLVQLTRRGESNDVYSLLVSNGVMDIPCNHISKDSYPSSDRLSAPEEESKTQPELPLEGAQKPSDIDLAEVQTSELD